MHGLVNDISWEALSFRQYPSEITPVQRMVMKDPQNELQGMIGVLGMFSP